LVKPLLQLLEQERQDSAVKLSELNACLRSQLALAGRGQWECLTPPSTPPQILSVRLPGYDAGVVVRLLAQDQGFQISAGSACAAESPRPSHVLMAMGYSAEEARQVIRISLSPTHTRDDVLSLVLALRYTLDNY
jgi:cysteine desulfurase